MSMVPELRAVPQPHLSGLIISSYSSGVHHAHAYISTANISWQPVDGWLPQQLVVQHRSSNELVADAVLKAAVDLWTAAMGVEHLEYLHLPLPVHVQLRHSAVQPHQNTAGILQRTHVAADQLVGDALCEGLEPNEKEKKSKRWADSGNPPWLMCRGTREGGLHLDQTSDHLR